MAIETKFALPYSFLSMAEMDEKILKLDDQKPHLWWRYIDEIFFIWEHGEEKLRKFYPLIKFTQQ